MCSKQGCSGSCSDCKKVTAKKADCRDCDSVNTGDVLSDGAALSCDQDEDFTIPVDKSQTDINAMFFSKLCALSTPDIYSSNDDPQNFTATIAAVTGVTATILETGKYAIYANLNYKHKTGSLQLISSGLFTLMHNDAEVTDVGVLKTLSSVLPAQATDNNTFVASLVHYMELTKDDTIKIGIYCGDITKTYNSLGGQLVVKRVLNFVEQP